MEEYEIYTQRKGYKCLKCFKECDIKEVCEWCRGSGEISTDEEDGEGHTMRGVGTEKCPCQIEEDEFEEDWSRG